MLNLKKIYPKTAQADTGFTLIEVVIAMLVAFFFVIGSMQALVLATAIRVKAQEKQRANQLIQEDIEQIRFEAETLPQNHSLCSATEYANSYAASLKTRLDNVAVPADKQLLDGKGKTYRLIREYDTEESTAKILKIDFSVKEWDGNNLVGDPIETDYIEVIPNAAVECPN
ncbi:MAG: prepilin-type N-terminal cleavage/methylation domain-containing protein [Xenococcaceae cyanobacterium]